MRPLDVLLILSTDMSMVETWFAFILQDQRKSVAIR